MLFSLILLGFLFSYSFCDPRCGTISFARNVFLSTPADEKIKISFVREGGILSTTTVMFSIQGVSYSVIDVNDDYEITFLPNYNYDTFELEHLYNYTEFRREDIVFNLTIISATSDNLECDIGSLSKVNLLIRSYGYGDSLSNTSSTQYYGVSNETQGWSINGNAGDESLFVDAHGFFMWDKVTGKKDNYIDNSVIKSPDFGFFKFTDIDSYILTTEFEIGTRILSMTMWIKCDENVNEDSVIVSIASSNVIFNEFILYNPYSLSIIVGESNINERNVGLKTNINIVDNDWHHIGLTWRSGDGKVLFYIDGHEVYTSGPYRSNYLFHSPVSIIIAAGQNGKMCEFVYCDTYGQFVGEIEDFKLFKSSLSLNDIFNDMKYNYPYSNVNNNNNNNNNLYLFYRAQIQEDGSDMVIDSSNKEGLELGFRADLEIEKIRIFNLTLKENIWYFRANENFVGNKTEYYKGYLQFQMMRGKAYGSPRNPERFIILEGGMNKTTGLPFRFSYKSEITELSEDWTYFSIPLWETDRWINEITGELTTEEDWMYLLSDLEKILIRGDFYDYSSKGNGNEVVYINNINIRNLLN